MKPNANKIKNFTQFTMRVENNLYKEIKESALLNKRSTAKEIEFILEKFLKSKNRENINTEQQ